MGEIILKAIQQVEFPIVVALILLGMLTGYIPGIVTREYLTEHLKQGEETVQLLRLICINTGQGPEAIQVCLKALDSDAK